MSTDLVERTAMWPVDTTRSAAGAPAPIRGRLERGAA